MRICMITASPLPPREGIGFYVWNLARHLVENGHEVQIITRGGAQALWRESVAGITIWRAPFVPAYPLHVHLHGLFVRQLARQLAGAVDLFHLHTPLVPVVDVPAPLLVTVHTPMKADAGAIAPTNALGLLVKLQAPVSHRLEQALFERADSIVAVAASVASELAAYGVDPARVAVLGNGVDTSIFTPHKQPAPQRHTGTEEASVAPYFLTAGRLAPRKGLNDLLRCAAIMLRQLPSHRFLIAGTGPLEGEVRAAIRQHGLAGRVVLLGHVADRAQMAELYRGATAYIHPAHYEGLPTVLLEAMACGRPVIATAVSGALDVIEHGRNGLLVPPRSPEALARAAALLVDQPALARRLGGQAHVTISERYSWHVVGRAYADEYAALLEGVRA